MSDVGTGMKKREPEEFENALMQALLRVDAPDGFMERVMGRAAEGAAVLTRVRKSGPGAPDVLQGLRGRVLRMRSRVASLSQQAWMGGAFAAMLVLGLFAGEQVHVRHEREQAEMATQQFETATRVTDHALQQVRAQLAQAGIRLQ